MRRGGGSKNMSSLGKYKYKYKYKLTNTKMCKSDSSAVMQRGGGCKNMSSLFKYKYKKYKYKKYKYKMCKSGRRRCNGTVVIGKNMFNRGKN